LADIVTKRRNVASGSTVTIGVRLINKSDGDIDGGHWFMVLPPGVSFESSSISVQNRGGIVSLDPVQIHTKAKLQFTIHVRISSSASGRLTFHTFLDDYEAYCEATDALTVRTAMYI
jgi:hypothetical protein